MNLAELFESIDREKLEEFVREGKEENLHLDFKTTKGSEFKSDDDKSSLAVALSGFANSDGGIIVWGVDCRKNENQVDCAQDFKFVENVSLFLTKLNDLTGDAVRPLVDGVLHKAIKIDSQRGCVVSLIPASDLAPHRAEFRSHLYYKRSGSSFYMMEHFDLADMFGRRIKPALSVEIEIHSHDHPHYSVIKFFIRNVGRSVAKYYGANIEVSPLGGNIELMNVVPPLNDIRGINSGRLVLSFSDNMGVLHPNGMRTYFGEITIYREKMEVSGVVAVSFFCEHVQVKTIFVAIPPLA